MGIIVGDTHGNVEKVRAFLAYKPDDLHVALGDYLDSFTVPAEEQLKTLQLLMSSNSILLFGNHDLHYLDYSLFQFAGYNFSWAGEFNRILEKNIDRFEPSYLADGWLCTHAGVNSTLVQGRSVQELEQLFCESWKVYLANRTGGYRFKSIFTFDFMCEGVLAPNSIKQVHGHDEHAEPGFTNPNCVSIGCNDKGTCWIFDTKTNEVINIGVKE